MLAIAGSVHVYSVCLVSNKLLSIATCMYCVHRLTYVHTALDDRNADAQWLRGAVYRCTLYLGDLGEHTYNITHTHTPSLGEHT